MKIAGALPRKNLLDSFRSKPEGLFQTKGFTHLGPLGEHQVVDRSGAERASGRKFLIRESDGKTPRIIFTDFDIGVGFGNPFSVTADIHSPDIETRISFDHPIRKRQADSTALTETSHHRAGTPVSRKITNGSHQGVSIRSKGERSVDDLLDACGFKGRKMLEAHFQGGGDSVQVRGQKFHAEIPGGCIRLPRNTGFLVGSHQHPFLLLT